ncbi:MAG: hypothetical protein WBD61_07695, partial [Desulfobulbales bacterium]
SYLSQGTLRTQETQKNQICSIETKILNSLRPLREDNVFVVCLLSVQNKNGKGKFMGHIWTHLVLQGNAKLLIKGRLQTYIRPIVGIF